MIWYLDRYSTSDMNAAQSRNMFVIFHWCKRKSVPGGAPWGVQVGQRGRHVRWGGCQQLGLRAALRPHPQQALVLLQGSSMGVQAQAGGEGGEGGGTCPGKGCHGFDYADAYADGFIHLHLNRRVKADLADTNAGSAIRGLRKITLLSSRGLCACEHIYAHAHAHRAVHTNSRTHTHTQPYTLTHTQKRTMVGKAAAAERGLLQAAAWAFGSSIWGMRVHVPDSLKHHPAELSQG